MSATVSRIFYANQPRELVVADIVRDNAMTSSNEGQNSFSSTTGGIVTSLEEWRARSPLRIAST